MRWLHFDRTDPSETAAHEAKLAAIRAWWSSFESRRGEIEGHLGGSPMADLTEWIPKQLAGIDPRLMWELGPDEVHGGNRLVITPENAYSLRPLVETLLQMAPDVAGWHFYGSRPAVPIEAMRGLLMARANAVADAFDVEVVPEEGGTVGLVFRTPPGAAVDPERSFGVVMIAAQYLLGERVVDEQIGAVSVEPAERPSWFGRLLGRTAPRRGVPLAELRPSVEALLAKHRDGLPDVPWRKRLEAPGAKAAVFKLQPEPADDWPAFADLLVAAAQDVGLWQAEHGGRFCAALHSRIGETFCYLKIDGAEGLDPAHFADRADVEEALLDVLGELGGVTGGGTGLRYSYIDLALTDFDAAWPRIQQRLRAGNLPKRSWLLFFEPGLAEEWLGIWPETPPPPARTP